MADIFGKIEQPEKEQKKKASLAEINARYRVKHTDEVKPPEIILKVHGKIVSTRQNIFGIKGKAKVGKSFLITLINSIVLQKGSMNMLESYLPAGRDKIIIIDTEQSRYHISLMMNRIKKLVEEHKLNNLFIYNLDSVPTADRLEYVETIIMETEGMGLVLIDGISDLVKSVNDEVVACDMADTLRRWATVRDIAIGYVLHENPSDSTKMRGHLGTILTNKSETVIQIEDKEGVKLVSTAQTRNAKPEDWSFEIIDGMPVIMDETYVEDKPGKRVVKLLNDIERYSLLNTVFAGIYAEGLPYSVMLESIREAYTIAYGNAGDTKIKQFITYCREKIWLVQPDGAKTNYHLYPFEK